MSTRLALCALAAALLWGCGSADPPPIQDEQLVRSLSGARSAYLQGQPEVAIKLYREALERARERDDQAAIAGISHDLGAVELQEGDAGAALKTARAALELYASEPHVLECLRRGLRGETFSTLIRTSGLTFEAFYQPVLDEAGRVTTLSIAALDVTERVRVEAEPAYFAPGHARPPARSARSRAHRPPARAAR